MAPKGWAALTSRKAFLDAKGDEFLRAKQANSLDSWWPGFFDLYFAEYHWSLPDDKEPLADATYTEPTDNDPLAIAIKETAKKKTEDVSSQLCTRWQSIMLLTDFSEAS